MKKGITITSKNVHHIMQRAIKALNEAQPYDPIVTSMYLQTLGWSDEQIMGIGYPKPPPKVFLPAQSTKPLPITDEKV